MKILDLVNKVLVEKETTTDANKKTLKIYYDVDALIQGFPEAETEEQPVKPVETKQTPPEETDVTATEGTLYEDIFKSSLKGETVVSSDDVNNIQTLEDLLDYLGDIKIGGKPIINEVIEEVALALSGVGAKALEDVVHEGDKIFVDIDYGKEKVNSIGVRVNKQSGSNGISISMKKNNKIIPGEFNLAELNKQIVFYRNSIFGK